MSAPLRLTIDILTTDGPVVHIGSHVRRGQWVEFYGLLAIARTDTLRAEEFLSCERLHTMMQWNHGKKISSVGKEVARHIAELAALDVQGLLDYELKTKFWRLAISAEQILFRPSREAVIGWLAAQTMVVADQVWVAQLEILVAAQVAVSLGEGSRARELLRALGSPAGPEFEAWAALLDARASDQDIEGSENALALDDLAEHWRRRGDIAGRAVGTRIHARNALRKRHGDPEVQYASLGKLAADLEQTRDVGSLASVINVLGVLANRLGRPAEAMRHHLRATALFGIVGDPNSMQSAIFNLANCCVNARRREHLRPDDVVLRILDCGIDFARTYPIGNDTLQSEISGCNWSIDMGDYARARRYLEDAAKLVGHLDARYDQGCYLLARARLEIVDPRGDVDIAHDLRAARRAFESAGDLNTVMQIDVLAKLMENHRSGPNPTT